MLRQQALVAELIPAKLVAQALLPVRGKTMSVLCPALLAERPVLLDSIGILLQAVALATAQVAQPVLLDNIGMGQRVLQIPLLIPQIRQPLALKVAEPGILQPITVKCRRLPVALLVHRDSTGTAQLVLQLPPLIVLPANTGTGHRVLALPQLLPAVLLDNIGTA